MDGNTSLEEFITREQKRINGWAIASFMLGVLGAIPWPVIFYTPFGGGTEFLVDLFFSCLCFGTPWINLAAIFTGGLAVVETRGWGNSKLGYLLALLGIALGVLAISFAVRNIFAPIFRES